MTDELEVLPLPSAQSSTPIRLPEPAAAQDIAAEPAPATPTGGAEESKHCEEEQPEEKMKTDTQMDEYLGSGGDLRLDISLLPVPKTLRPTAADAQGRPTITSNHAHTTRSRRRKSSCDDWSAANRPSSPAP